MMFCLQSGPHQNAGKSKIYIFALLLYLLSFGPVVSLMGQYEIEESLFATGLAIFYLPLCWLAVETDIGNRYLVFWLGITKAELAAEIRELYLNNDLELDF